MKGPRTAPRVVLAIAIVTLVGSIIGFIVTLLMNIFVWDKFDAYGEVPIPGSASLHLPQGEVTVSFHTQIIGTTSGGGLPVPNMGLSIAAPDGVPDPQITEDIGSTTTVNSDARIRVWVVQIPVEGTYDVSTEGNVSAFVSPRLAFGHGSSLGWLPVVFGVLMAVSILDVIVAAFWLTRRRSPPAPAAPVFEPVFDQPPVTDSPTSFEPTEDGIRLQHLKTLAALRDSGALTEDEFESEKKRLLDGR